MTFWYDYLGRVAFTQHDEYTNEYGYNHWGETGWDWFIYDGWNVVQEIDAYWWMPKAQYSWGLDLSQTLQGAGGIGGLLAMHVPADRCAAIGGGGASAMSFQMPGSLAGLLEEAAAEGSGDPSAGDEPVGILERLIARRDALLAAGLLGGTGGVSESTQTQIDGGEVQTLTTGGDCDFWYLYDANGNVGQLLNYDAGTSAVSLAAAYEYDPYGNTLVVRDIDNSGIAAANKYRFSTKRLIDELAASGQGGALGTTGLYYYGYRFYSPGLGRWISRDPIEEEGGLNLYAFAHNQAPGRIDPLGLFSPEGHFLISTQATFDSGLFSWAAGEIVDADVHTDIWHFFGSEYHAQSKSWPDLLRSQMQKIKTEDCRGWFGVRSRSTITTLIGEAMHTLQDVYAHTDYIEGTQNGMHDLYLKYVTEVDGYDWQYLTLSTGTRPSHSAPIDLLALVEKGESFGTLTLYEGGINPYDNSPHNWFAADAPGKGRDIYVSGSYQRAESLAVKSSQEFIGWVRANVTACCRELLFAGG